ncbi:hypothetical protein CPT_Slocum_174 [Serratia phage Slocum]|nr:hypothetical protein CPT_Slocum_174 [Serratia phage Slocum]
MIDLKKIAIDTREIEVDYPGLPGFKLKVRHISRSASKRILKGAEVSKMANGRVITELDTEKFNRDFAAQAIVGWEGLTIAYVDQILLIDSEGHDPETEVEFSIDNAQMLMENSSSFEEFINSTVFSLDSFRSIKS